MVVAPRVHLGACWLAILGSSDTRVGRHVAWFGREEPLPAGLAEPGLPLPKFQDSTAITLERERKILLLLTV